jgi:pyruvate/2-oxoglutarate/acetoin dehydrogenase E1 component
MTVTGTQISFEEAVTEALRLEMHRDPALVMFTAAPDGIAGRLLETFGGDRVVEARSAGAALVLAACGAAEEGLRPICELGPADAGAAALDQIAELAAIHAADLDTASPVTVRLSWGDPLTAGGAAATDPLAWLLGAEGVKLVAPATPADAKGLTVAAVRDQGPVCVLEHAYVRAEGGPVPEGAHVVSIGSARLAREGERMTIVTHGAGLSASEAAADRIDGAAELIDLRTLQPLDTDAVLTSVRKTGRVLFAEPGGAANRVTAQLVSAIWEGAFEYLDAPPRRVRLCSPERGGPLADGGRVWESDVDAVEEISRELLEY